MLSEAKHLIVGRKECFVGDSSVASLLREVRSLRMTEILVMLSEAKHLTAKNETLRFAQGDGVSRISAFHG
jgi:hypothetical protein